MISGNSNISFKGYDVMPLRGFLMQGFCDDGVKIFHEIKNIAQKENIDIFVSQDNTEITKSPKIYNEDERILSRWAQDNKAFVLNKVGKIILHNSKEPTLEEKGLGELSDFQIDRKKYMPRGGNYYIGYKENGDKWMIINSISIADNESFAKFGDTPTKEHLIELFDIKPENIYKISDFTNDIDEVIRPLGYPNILVNDYHLSLKNLEKMRNKFPESSETYNALKKYLIQKIKEECENIDCAPSTSLLCYKLRGYGFNPIRIGGRYDYDINYMNALAFRDKKDGISYITNSTKDSYPELLYLEELFEKDLRNKVPEITNIYHVSGGKKEIIEATPGFFDILDRGLKNKNVVMNLLSKRGGGIHCMTAEIPDFDRIC